MEVITDVLQIADLYPYPAALYVATLPSGGRVAIEASATFGEVVIILLLIIVAGLMLARLVQSWKNS